MKKVLVICLLTLTWLSYSYSNPSGQYDESHEVAFKDGINAHDDFDMNMDLIAQAYPEPIVAEKPTFIQRQLMKVGLPIYFALRASKNYVISFFKKTDVHV